MNKDEKKRVIQERLMILRLAKELGNISLACEEAGVSRDTFYRYKRLYESGGKKALGLNYRKAPKLKNRVPRKVEAAILKSALSHPDHGQARIAGALAARGLSVSPSGVRSVLLRTGLETYAKRLKALRVHLHTSGNKPTKSQSVLLGKG